MSLVDPSTPVLIALTTLIVAANLALVAGMMLLLLRLLAEPELPAPDTGDDGWDDGQAADDSPPAPPGPFARPVPRHRRRSATARHGRAHVRPRRRTPATH